MGSRSYYFKVLAVVFTLRHFAEICNIYNEYFPKYLLKLSQYGIKQIICPEKSRSSVFSYCQLEVTNQSREVGLSAVNLLVYALCQSTLPPDCGTLISKWKANFIFIWKEDFGPPASVQSIFFLHISLLKFFLPLNFLWTCLVTALYEKVATFWWLSSGNLSSHQSPPWLCRA